MPGKMTFREQVIEKFKKALGKPEVMEVASGKMYRWTLERGRTEINMYVTIDSPEHPDIAHVLISDGSKYQVDPVLTITIYTLDEADEVIRRILDQWKRPGAE